MANKCEPGQRYDVGTLEFLMWNDGRDDIDGYSCWDYFAEDGEYLGPDEYDVEPLFQSIEEAALN